MMLDPYKMIAVNLTALSILTAIILLYKLNNPTKKVNLLYLLISLTLIASISIFRTGSYESGDFNIHVYRSMEFFGSLSEGNFLPSWASNLNATYGYPLFIFNYSLPYYLISFLHYIGFSFISSLKLFLAGNMFLSALFMYKYVQDKFKNNLVSFTATIFYVFFPYHLITIHFKITIGEILSYTLIPLVFLFLDKFIANKKTYYIIAAGLMMGLIALSHMFIFIFLLILCIFYLIIYLHNIQEILRAFLPVALISLLISSYQWLPPLIFSNELFISKYPIDLNTLFFPSLSDLAYSTWRYGLLFQGPKGEISYLIGYAQWFLIASCLFVILKNKISNTYKTKLIILLILLFSTILLMTPQSKFLWDKLVIINTAGAHRLMLITGFILALMAAHFTIVTKNKILIYFLILIAIVSTMLNWGQRRVIPEINDRVLQKNLPLSTYQGEAHFYANTKYVNPKDPWFKAVPKESIETVKGNAQLDRLYSKSTIRAYTAQIQQDSLLSEKTLYFPGWRVYANKKEIRIFPGRNGEINFMLPTGNYNIQLIYEDVPELKLAKIISTLVLFTVLAYLFFAFKPHRTR